MKQNLVSLKIWKAALFSDNFWKKTESFLLFILPNFWVAYVSFIAKPKNLSKWNSKRFFHSKVSNNFGFNQSNQIILKMFSDLFSNLLVRKKDYFFCVRNFKFNQSVWSIQNLSVVFLWKTDGHNSYSFLIVFLIWSKIHLLIIFLDSV